MTAYEERAMGDVIEFPDRDDTNDTESGRGTVVRAVAERISPEEATESTEQPVAEPAAEVVQRGPVIPPALVGKAKQAGKAALPVGTQAAQFTARHLYLLAGGAWDTAAGVYSRWTGRDIDERIAAAQAAGEHGVVAQLSAQRTESRKLFLERIKVFGGLLMQTPKFLAASGGLFLTVTFIVSVIAWVQPGGMGFSDVWSGLFAAIAAGFDWAVWAASWAPWAGVATLAGVLVKGYNTRRRRGDAVPAFLAAPGTAGGEVVITPSVVVTALQRSGLPALRRAIGEMDEHQRSAMLSPIRLAGCGVELDVTLPSSGDTTVTAAEVQARREKIAEGLGRFAHEVFITPAPAARSVRLWIADSGALDEPIGPSPLVGDEFDAADIYAGRAPWGQTLRGDAFLLKLWQCHLLATGLSNQGKTAALRALVLWLLLDPSVELHLADLKGVGDWNMVKPLAETYIAGPSDDHVSEATVLVEWAVGEMSERLQKLEANADRYPNGITPELSRDRSSGFHPIVLVIDEAQRAFECPAKDGKGRPYGGTKTTSRYFNAVRQIQNQGRAVGVTIWQGTQDPTNENLPKRIREGAHIRASLVVGTESQARMALGEAAVDSSGAAPHELRQGKDKGVLVVKDADNTIETVRTHFIDGTAATTIAERAAAIREAAGVREREQVAEQERDLLADVADVLDGEPKVKATDVVARLRKLAPHYPPYTDLNAEQLRAQLGEHGVDVTKSGVYWVYTERVQLALVAREGGTDAS